MGYEALVIVLLEDRPRNLNLGSYICSGNHRFYRVESLEVESTGGENTLHFAAENGHKATIKLLLKWGVSAWRRDASGKSALASACMGSSGRPRGDG
jgi:ankyrin repeat protein